MFETIELSKSKSLIPTITDCHIKRIGWTRTLLGGFSMYLSIPTWIIFHLTTATFLYQKLLRPLLGTPEVKWTDHVIMDRHRIQGLVKVDKFNCLFCGYANGLTTMLNCELDNIHYSNQAEIPHINKVAAVIIAILFLPITILADILCIRIVYNNIIAAFLGMHTAEYGEVQKLLVQEKYGDQFNPYIKALLVYTKNVYTRLALLLEQIESSWCPLQHFERKKGVVYPKHHEKFLRPDQLDLMREILSTKGTVSDKLPKECEPIFDL